MPSTGGFLLEQAGTPPRALRVRLFPMFLFHSLEVGTPKKMPPEQSWVLEGQRSPATTEMLWFGEMVQKY